MSTRLSSPSTSQTSGARPIRQSSARPLESIKSLYQADHQIKLLHLHAEADSLLQQLQTLKQRQQLQAYLEIDSYSS